MPAKLTVYLHFPCFDGVISAVLAAEYLRRKQGLETGGIMPVNYGLRGTWLATPLAKPAAVVDFLYHPDADFWADHHQTTFLTAEAEADFRERRSGDLLYDAAAPACADVLWRKTYRLLREPRFREMVEWARRIDSASYSSVNEAVLGDVPAMRISLSFIEDATPEYCSFLVQSLRSQSLAEVAASARVDAAYRKVRRATLNGQKHFRKAAHLEKDQIVVFDVKNKGSELTSRYAPYLEYPDARYSVGILDTGDGAKITAMRNPWRRFKSVPLGAIFSRYGGGGHQRVASALFPSVDDARRSLGCILSDIRSAGAEPPREAEAGD